MLLCCCPLEVWKLETPSSDPYSCRGPCVIFFVARYVLCFLRFRWFWGSCFEMRTRFLLFVLWLCPGCFCGLFFVAAVFWNQRRNMLKRSQTAQKSKRYMYKSIFCSNPNLSSSESPEIWKRKDPIQTKIRWKGLSCHRIHNLEFENNGCLWFHPVSPIPKKSRGKRRQIDHLEHFWWKQRLFPPILSCWWKLLFVRSLYQLFYPSRWRKTLSQFQRTSR